MISKRSAEDLRILAMAGASLEVNGDSYPSESLRVIAMALRPGAHLKIVNSAGKDSESLRVIAMAKPGQVVIA